MRADAVGLPDMPATCSVAVKMLKGTIYHSHYIPTSSEILIRVLCIKPIQMKLHSASYSCSIVRLLKIIITALANVLINNAVIKNYTVSGLMGHGGMY